jgi:hypothetical protein
VVAGVRDGDEWAAQSAAPNALLLHSSAEGVFGAAIARDDSQRDRINLFGMLSERSPRASFRSAPHRTMWRSAVRHERDVSNIRLVASGVNDDQTSTIAQEPDSSGAQAGSTPVGRAERTVGAQRRALRPPSTASKSTTRWATDFRATRGEM